MMCKCRFISVTNVPPWCGMLIKREAVHVGGQGGIREFYVFQSIFALNLILNSISKQTSKPALNKIKISCHVIRIETDWSQLHFPTSGPTTDQVLPKVQPRGAVLLSPNMPCWVPPQELCTSCSFCLQGSACGPLQG